MAHSSKNSLTQIMLLSLPHIFYSTIRVKEKNTENKIYYKIFEFSFEGDQSFAITKYTFRSINFKLVKKQNIQNFWPSPLSA